MTAAAIAAASFQNMVDPPCAGDALAPVAGPLGGTALGDFERVAIGSEHVNGDPGFERDVALDARVPARAAIAHAGEARAGIDPVLEGRRHAGVERRHLLRAVLRAVSVHAVAPGPGDDDGNDDLHGEDLACAGDRS